MLKNSKPILVVPGDPKSIFFEIFFKSFQKSRKPLILITNKKLINNQMKMVKVNFILNQIKETEIFSYKFNKKKINFINVNYEKNHSKKYINSCFQIALKILKKDNEIKLINGPINKEKFLNKKYHGITEYLAAHTKNKEVVMLIYNKKLAVSPLTTHIPLKKVHINISKKKIINHVNKIQEFYKFNFNKKPKIALTGLNPHCESNFINSEEKKIIYPAIKYLRSNGFNVSGPFPADTIFLKKNYEKYDVILGMYHDQVLSPIKSIFGFKAINITLGLPFTRVSPDHGPNVKMFGKNLSNPDSLIESIKFLNN